MADIFLSTPSARRATKGQRGPKTPDECISIHALREEGDAKTFSGLFEQQNISIHALREEGDGMGNVIIAEASPISIHALREEGDPPAL